MKLPINFIASFVQLTAHLIFFFGFAQNLQILLID